MTHSGTIKVFNQSGDLTHYFSFRSKEAYNKIMNYIRIERFVMYEVLLDGLND